MRRCPHCGRPFVSARDYSQHVDFCERVAQAKLDRDWEEGQQKQREFVGELARKLGLR